MESVTARSVHAERGRWATAASLVTWSVCVGTIGGLAFGWIMAAIPGANYRSVMGVRQWADALSYSGLAHGIIWAVQGMVVGAACAIAAVASRRIRRAVRPGVMALASLLAGAGTFILWFSATDMGVAVAMEPQSSWWGILAGFWLLVAVAGYTAGHHLAGPRLGPKAESFARSAFGPAGALLLVCLAIQWMERPRLSTAPTWDALSLAAAPDHKDPRPNIVLVVLDTQRVDRLGCYGCDRPTTPYLDAFAADATVFDNCISPAIWTLPAHTSMFTGLFPSEHGVNWHHLWVDDQFKTAAQYLQESGYQTICFTSNTFIGSLTNLSRGFDGFVQPYLLHTVRGNGLFKLSVRTFYPAGYVGKWLGRLAVEDGGGKFTNQLVARFLAQRDRRRPFFLFINYMEPHEPYRPPLPHRELFIKPSDIESSYRDAWWHKRFEYSLLKHECFTPEQLRVLNQTYDAETRLQDDYVGELLAMLAENVSLENTLIIITADHGESLGDHHILGHGWCVYDTLAHVPLIVRYPKRIKPGRRQELVQTVDVLPTIMDALNGRPVKTPSTFGSSLLRAPGLAVPHPTTATSAPATLPASGLTGRVVVTERMAPQDPGLDKAQQVDTRFNRVPYECVIRAVRQGPWKYVVYADGREELYNVADDPGELKSLLESRRPIASYLAVRLNEWLAAAKTYEGPSRLDGERRLDTESQRRLRDLGYIQ